MTHSRLIGITALFATLSLPAKAASGREAITAAQIAAAIGVAGMQVSAEQVTLLSDVVAKTDAPALRVESMGPWQGNLTRVRLDCVVSDECLPFVVTVRRSPKNDSGGEFVPSDRQPSRQSSIETPKSKVVVRLGSPAILLLDGGHVHIQLAVVCLENGAAGQTIRVSGKSQPRIYLAEVGSDGVLRGRL
jgi:hypothetical protein